MSESSQIVSELIDAFGRGDTDAGGELLARYRPWLQLLARLETDSRFGGRFDASDIVQQTMLEAVRDFPKFRGTTETELSAWLRQILAHVLTHHIQHHAGAQKRDLGREVSIDQGLAQSSQRLRSMLEAPDSSPSKKAIRHEQEVLLADALEKLPDEYREVIILRNLQSLSHEEIARRMNRNLGATRMLWVRALARLRKEADSLGP